MVAFLKNWFFGKSWLLTNWFWKVDIWNTKWWLLATLWAKLKDTHNSKKLLKFRPLKLQNLFLSLVVGISTPKNQSVVFFNFWPPKMPKVADTQNAVHLLFLVILSQWQAHSAYISFWALFNSSKIHRSYSPYRKNKKLTWINGK